MSDFSKWGLVFAISNNSDGASAYGRYPCADVFLVVTPRATTGMAWLISSLVSTTALAASLPVQDNPLDVRTGQACTARPHEAVALESGEQRIGLLTVDAGQASIPADGMTQVHVQITASGVNGQPLLNEQWVRVRTSGIITQSGRSPDLDVLGDGGVRVRLVNGQGHLDLTAPSAPQDVSIEVSSGGKTNSACVAFVPALRKMLVVGLAEGVIGFNRGLNLGGQSAQTDDGFDQAITSFSHTSADGTRDWAVRTALFLRGQIKGNALLTLAYDSDKSSHERMFGDIRPEEYYPVYGDSSLRGNDALSNSRLYVRLDKGPNSIQFGDLRLGNAQATLRGSGSLARPEAEELGRYTRSITGGLVHVELPRAGYLTAFVARDNLRQAVYEVAGIGTSGPYGVPNSGNAVQGTEIVERLVRDRFQPSVILSVTPLSSIIDYTFEPFSGRILFAQPIPSVDGQLNPVSVRISYEVDQGGEKYWLFGAEANVSVVPGLTVGGNIVRDENPFAPYKLMSANTTVALGRHTVVVLEAARTTSIPVLGSGGMLTTVAPTQLDEVSGNAYRIELVSTSKAFQARVYAARTDLNFNNPSTSLIGGREEVTVELKAPLTQNLAGIVRASRSSDQVADAKRQTAEAGVAFRYNDRLRFEGTVKYTEDNGGTASLVNNGTDGLSSLSPLWNPGMYGGGVTGQNGASSSNPQSVGTSNTGIPNTIVPHLPVNYTGVQLTAFYKATKRLELSTQLLQDVQFADHRSLSAGAKYQLTDETRVYGRYEYSGGLGSVATVQGAGGLPASAYRSSTAVFGFESEYVKNASAFTEYRMTDALSARDTQLANGLRNSWRLNDKLRLNTSVERLTVLNGAGQSANAVTAAIEWAPTRTWLIAARLEFRHTYDGAPVPVTTFVNNALVVTPGVVLPGYNTVLDTITVARKLSQNWTVLARDYGLFSKRIDGLGQANENRFQAGIAYRDNDTDRHNVLVKYEHWTRSDAGNVLGTTATAPDPDTLEGFTRDIVSILADWHPVRPLWMTVRIAAKREADFYPANSVDNGSSSWGALLLSGRAVYDISPRIDLGVMGSQLRGISATDHGRQSALGLEAGYLVQDNVWLSLGYNIRGFTAADMTGADYTQHGTYLRLRMKFDEDLFGGRSFNTDRSKSRSPAPGEPQS